VFEDYAGRRRAILRALTADVEKFYASADPTKENLCLYGYPDGSWAVDLPAEEVPPEVPEPALGINFARDGMQRKDWLGLVAVHSDAWLLALAFYKGARLTKEEREELFLLINKLPTCYEVVSGRVKTPAGPGPSGPQMGAPPTQHKRPGPPGAGRPPPKAQKTQEDDDDDDEDDEGWEDGEGDPCPSCGRLYRTDEFWIACDFCDTWYCGRCSKMTSAKAEKVKNWKCPGCSGLQA